MTCHEVSPPRWARSRYVLDVFAVAVVVVRRFLLGVSGASSGLSFAFWAPER